MTEKEKEAIKHLKNGKKINIYTLLRTLKKEGIENFIITRKRYLDTILNLIQKQQEEIEQNNKVIDKRNQEKLELTEMCLKKDKIINEMISKLQKGESLKTIELDKKDYKVED